MTRTDYSANLIKSTPLTRRAFAFLALFLVASGTIGPRIISSGFMERYLFDIYGGLGKALLFGAIALAILVMRHKGKPYIADWNRLNILWVLASLACYIFLEATVGKLEQGVHGAFWPIMAHLSLILCVSFALIGTFGLNTLKSLIQSYKKELLISAGLAAGFYLLLLVVYNFWEVLSAGVLHGVRALLGLIGIASAVDPPRTLLFDKFGIEVAQYCSGIESIALFSGLYVIIGILDWPKFNHKKLLIAFPIALIVLFACNILRVFLLIVAGYYINPEIAFSLFHTYAGMLFFIVYSGIFWWLFYRRLLNTKTIKSS